MNWETVGEFISLHWIVISVGVGCFVAGIVLKGIFSSVRFKFAQLRNNEVLALQKTRQAELEVELKKAEQAAEIARIEMEGRAAADLRKSAEAEKVRRHRLELAGKLVELRPVLQEYLQAVQEASSTGNDDYMELRQLFRGELIKDFIDSLGRHWDLDDADFYMSSNDRARIEAFVDAKYPLEDAVTAQIPPAIKKLIDLLEIE